MKKITLIYLTDPCTDINMFNLSNLNKKCLIAETKMKCVS